VKTGGADVEAYISMNVDIISFAEEIVMKLVLYVHRAEHSDIQANCHSFLASKFVLEIYENLNNI
jgi:hypothetical protein